MVSIGKKIIQLWNVLKQRRKGGIEIPLDNFGPFFQASLSQIFFGDGSQGGITFNAEQGVMFHADALVEGRNARTGTQFNGVFRSKGCDDAVEQASVFSALSRAGRNFPQASDVFFFTRTQIVHTNLSAGFQHRCPNEFYAVVTGMQGSLFENVRNQAIYKG
jgi:hypothetical protein